MTDTSMMRQDTWRNMISIDGGPMIIMDTCKGGDNDSDTKVYRPGGMRKAKVVGGFQTVSNLTLDKSMEREVDWAIVAALMRAAPGRSRAVVSRQPLDDDGNNFGSPIVYNGVIKQIIPGDADASRADTQVWSVVVTPNTDIG